MPVQLQMTTGKALDGVKAPEAIHMYFHNEISWVELAPVMDTMGLDLEKDPDLELEDKQRRKLRRVIQALRLLKLRRPDFIKRALKEPQTWVPNHEAVNYLLVLFRECRDPDRQAQFQANIQKVLNGDLSERHIRLLVKKQRRKGKGASRSVESEGTERESKSVSPNQKDKGDPVSVSALEAALTTLNYVIDSALEKNSYLSLRTVLGKECRAMSTRLSCIADAEFLRLWKERKTVEL